MKYKTLKRAMQATIAVGAIAVVAPVLEVDAQGIGLRKLDELMTPTQPRVDRGAKIYAQNCSSCHGDEGKGGAELASQFNPPPGGFTDGQWKYGGGLIQIYNAISKGEMTTQGPVADAAEAQVVEHPAFGYLAYQDRWAVAHYVRSVAPSPPQDPPAIVEQAKFEAENGYCRDELKSTISQRITPGGEEQMNTAKEIYAAQCASCHGEEGKGDGAAAAALQPAPRNFHKADVKWTNGSSPLAIFNTLTNGIEGTSMASYSSLSEDERWALSHYVRTWVPEEAKENVSDQEVLEVCRSLSAPPKPPAIPVNLAMKVLVEDAPQQKAMEIAEYGPVLLDRGANAAAGQSTYTRYCSDCHGPNGAGSKQHGPYGAFPPYLYLSVSRLTPAMAGGSVDEFASRSLGGVHATLSDMTSASHLSTTAWQNLHAFVARFDGGGQVKFADEVPAVNTEGEGSEEDPALEPESANPEAPAKPAEEAADPAEATPAEAKDTASQE